MCLVHLTVVGAAAMGMRNMAPSNMHRWDPVWKGWVNKMHQSHWPLSCLLWACRGRALQVLLVIFRNFLWMMLFWNWVYWDICQWDWTKSFRVCQVLCYLPVCLTGRCWSLLRIKGNWKESKYRWRRRRENLTSGKYGENEKVCQEGLRKNRYQDENTVKLYKIGKEEIVEKYLKKVASIQQSIHFHIDKNPYV